MCELLTTFQANDTPAGSRRRKLWELAGRFHCSVIGTCLTLGELKKILQRCQISVEGEVSDYDLHGAFVNMADKACSATRQVQKFLDRKHAAEIRRLAKERDPAALGKAWDERFGTGQVAGAYWALVTHPFATEALLTRAYGEVHMLSHQIGATNRVDIRRLAMLERRCTDLEAELSASRARSTQQLNERDAARRKINARLIEAIDAERQLQFATCRIRHLESGKEHQHLRQRVRELTHENQVATSTVNRALAERDELAQSLEETRKRNADLQALLELRTAELRWLQQAQQESSDLTPCPPDEGSVPTINLCGRCVLFVGGRIGQCSYFRRLVEHNHGRFLHHDGGREDCPQRLGTMLPQADVVLCPVDCVSHDAVNRIKRFCSQHAKRLILMPRASLSAFTRSLKEVAA